MPLLSFFSAAATSLWLAMAYLHISDQIGWQIIHTLPFHEQAILWITIFAPVGFLWLTVATLYRDRDLHHRMDQLMVMLNAFIEPAGKKNQYAQDALASMKEQAQALEAGSEATARSAELLSTALSEKLESMTLLEQKLAERCKIIETGMSHQLEKIRDMSDQTSARSENTRRGLQQALDSFEQAIDTIWEKTKQTRSAFEEYAQSVHTLAEKTLRNEKEISGSIAQQNKDLQSATDAAADQARYVRESFALYTTELEKAADDATDRANTLGSAIRQQTQDIEQTRRILEQISQKAAATMRDTLSDMKESSVTFTDLANTTIDKFETGSESVAQISRQSNETVGHLIDRLSKAREQIETSAQGASHNLQTLCDTVVEQANRFMESSNQAATRIGEATENLMTQSTSVEQVARISKADITKEADDMQKIITLLSENGTNVTRLLSEQKKILNDEIRELQTAVRDAVTGIHQKKNMVEEQVGMLRNMSDQTQNELQSAHRKLQVIGSDVGSIWKESSLQVKEASARFREQKTDFEKTLHFIRNHGIEISDSLGQRVAEWGTVVKNFEKSARSAEEGFQAQMDQLLSTTREIETRAQEATKNAFMTQRAGFLEASSFVTEKLQSLSVDIARLLDPQASGDDWDRYLQGDRGIFVRVLGRGRDAKMAEKIRQQIKENEQFRTYVLEYMSEFKTLIGQAHSVDHNQVLEKTFLSADVGKVYALLERALESKK